MTSRIIDRVTSPTDPPDGLETFLCDYRSHFFFALPGTVDRTREVRCPPCQMATLGPWWDEETTTDRLMKGTF